MEMLTPTLLIMATIWMILVYTFPQDVKDTMLFKHNHTLTDIIIHITLWVLFIALIYLILNLGDLL